MDMGFIQEKYGSPGYFTQVIAADSRRKEFDIKNDSLMQSDQKPDFIFIGDSITHYWELRAYFHYQGQLIVNRGIGGDTTEYLKKRFYADVLQLNPKYCIMGIGINDSIELEGDYWKLLEPKPYEEVLCKAQKNIEDIILQAKNEDMVLILTSLLPIHMPISLNESARKQYINDMNQWMKQITRREELIFVNYFEAMVVQETSELLDGITYDGIHPNGKGYEIMASVLKNTLHQNKIII